MEYLEKWRTAARKNLMYSLSSKYVICEALRLIYDEIHDLPDEKLKERITERLVDAMLMAKKMQDRLKYYQRKYNDESGSRATTIERLLGSVRRRAMRKERMK